MKAHLIQRSTTLFASLLLTASAVHATLIFSEDFNYDTGSLAGQGPWSGGGTVIAPTSDFSSFDAGENIVIPSIGNQAKVSNATASTAIVATPSGSGSSFFVSFVAQVSSGSGNQYGGIRIQDSTTGTYLLFGQTWNSPNWGVSVNGTNYSTTIANSNVSLFVVQVTYTAANAGNISVYINPMVSDSGVISSSPALSQIGAFLGANGYNQLTLSTGTANSTLNIDTIRIGTTLSDVLTIAPIPEPATYALIISICFLTLVAKRRFSIK